MRKRLCLIVAIGLAIGLALPVNQAYASAAGGQVHNVYFSTSGLPGGVSITVSWSKTNPAGNSASGSTTFTSPGPSAAEGTKPGTIFSYSGFPSTVTVSGNTYELVSTLPASPFTTGAGDASTTVTATYRIKSASSPLSIVAPNDITVEGNTTGGATGVSLGDPTVSGGTPPYTITNDAPSKFPLGETIVKWTVTDANGKTASDTQVVTVKDTTPPTITAPLDLTVEGNTTSGATGIDLGSPEVSDIVDPNPTVTNNAPSFFPLGETTVTWTATDSSGNSASAEQKVTVVDTTPPKITVVSSIAVTVGAPKSVLPEPEVSDIVDANPIVINDAPDFFPAGVTVVTWTATDDSGNSATAKTTVTAVYNFGGFLPPVVISGVGNGLFNAGSTIPVKFRLTDYNGNPVETATGTASINTSPAVSASIRYDALAMQYIANLKTPRSVAPGTYKIKVALDDGTSYEAKVNIR